MQHLEADRRAAQVAGQQRGRRRQPPPGAGPAQGHPLGVDAERAGLGVQERQRGVAVVQAGRVRVLGGQPVLDRHHDRAGVDGHERRAGVLGLDAADDEAAAVDHARCPAPATAADPGR